MARKRIILSSNKVASSNYDFYKSLRKDYIIRQHEEHKEEVEALNKKWCEEHHYVEITVEITPKFYVFKIWGVETKVSAKDAEIYLKSGFKPVKEIY